MDSSISVLIPVYNGGKYLSDCIRSVRAQTLQAAEIVVIDDGSEDCTPQVVAAWGAHVRYQRVAHGGLPYARNRALRIAEFDVIAFVDSDDIWLPNKLELQMAALGQEAGPVMVFGYVQQFISSDLRSEEAARLKYNPTPLPGILSSTLLMRKSDCESVGSFDESMQTGEFIEWCSRAKDMGVKSVLIPDLVCRRRLHRNNIGRGGSETHRNYAHVIKKILDRRRQRG